MYIPESLTEQTASCTLEATGVWGIESGINNWLTCVYSNGKRLSVDGGKLKV
ncbi:hypothetical protein [Microcoleus sp. LEGE 07076]|uniref:hypothetical protein n=1 Tax=Microcoleus sp. LEGE 07076 TaxID=915322 RepID=UPI001D132E98|nr:hypothetical protein [Microcoleus sp. LEGE 07076]